ncbi:hypothetical protein Shyhy01_20300 [Streptomyces hygroscopicus subsp. hygroscopicus]|nr:hypothetical protein Shyhy01_20300 [Streptomyces hygroscopicus subsp. hygroscopicus]
MVRAAIGPNSSAFPMDAARADAVDDGVGGQVVRADDVVRQADDVRGTVRVAVAHGGQPALTRANRLTELLVPGADRVLVVVRPRAGPHLGGIGVVEAELPLAVPGDADLRHPRHIMCSGEKNMRTLT